MDTLKAKLVAGKTKGISFLQSGASSLNVSSTGDESGVNGTGGARASDGRRGSLGGFRAGASGQASSGFNENSARRGSLSSASTGPPNSWNNNTAEGRNSLSGNRPIVDLIDTSDSGRIPNGSGTALDGNLPAFAAWKPLEPERKTSLGTSSPPGVSQELRQNNSPNNVSTSGSSQFTKEGIPPVSTTASPTPVYAQFTNSTASSSNAPPPSSTLPKAAAISTQNSNSSPSRPSPVPPPRASRPTPGKIMMPPPPSLVSRKSTMGNNGRLTGLNIVPSTPVPRQIANLPTLNGISAGGSSSRRSSDDYGFGNVATPINSSPAMSREPSGTTMAGQNRPGSSGTVGGSGSRTPTAMTSPMRGLPTSMGMSDLRLMTPTPRPEAKRARSIMVSIT